MLVQLPSCELAHMVHSIELKMLLMIFHLYCSLSFEIWKMCMCFVEKQMSCTMHYFTHLISISCNGTCFCIYRCFGFGLKCDKIEVYFICLGGMNVEKRFFQQQRFLTTCFPFLTGILNRQKFPLF